MTAAHAPAAGREVRDTAGTALARAVAAKDDAALRALLADDVDFRAMTPGRFWEGTSAADVLHAVHLWFADDDDVEELVHLETDAFADRERVGYRLRVRNADGVHLVDQQAYLSERDGRVGWLRVMCAGYRPVAGPA